MTASAAARRMSSGPGSSGKPWPRLMALLSRASCDIASKMVTGRSAKTLFMEVMAMGVPAKVSRGSWSAIPRPSSPVCPRKMLIIGKARGLRRQGGRYRPLAGTASENHLLALGIGNIARVETRKRYHDRAGIGFHRHFIRLADIDQKVATVGHSLRYFLRRQILDLMACHAIPPNDPLLPIA